MMKHSFAVMAYKDSPYLADCIRSLQNQTVKSNIYVTTSTPSNYIDDISKEFGIEVFKTKSGFGIGHDWNFSFSNAKTKYVTLAHQDDVYDPAYTENCLRASEKFKDTLICFTSYGEILVTELREKNLTIVTKEILLRILMPFKGNSKGKFAKKLSLAFGNPISCPGVMYNKELLGDFRFSDQYAINLDWDAWLRMSTMNGRFVYIPKHLFKHRIHAESATTEGLKENVRQREDLDIFCRIWPKFIARILSKFYSGSYKSNKV
jgi:glycosyltransferase involved in cell wall biosynthesis